MDKSICVKLQKCPRNRFNWLGWVGPTKKVVMLTFRVNRDGDKDVALWVHEYLENEVIHVRHLINSVDNKCRGFNRIVVGGRGPYVEFLPEQLNLRSIHVPSDQLYRFHDRRSYYIEFRTNDTSNVMVYYQLRTVAYADYKIGMFYISPYDLYLSNGCRIINGKSGEVFRENPKMIHFF